MIIHALELDRSQTEHVDQTRNRDLLMGSRHLRNPKGKPALATVASPRSPTLHLTECRIVVMCTGTFSRTHEAIRTTGHSASEQRVMQCLLKCYPERVTAEFGYAFNRPLFISFQRRSGLT